MKKQLSRYIHYFRSHGIKIIVSRLLTLFRIITRTGRNVMLINKVLPPFPDAISLSIGMIDHSYHNKTISSFFFAEILKHLGQVEVFWDSKWNGGLFPSYKVLRNKNFDVLVVFQSFYYHKPSFLKKIACRRTFIVPMYDDSYNIPDSLLLKYKEFSFINFAKAFQDRFERLGIRSFNCKYFPDPETIEYHPTQKNELHGFFWQRTNDITWLDIRQLIEGTSFKSFHLHLALDPIWYKEVLPTESEMKKYNITISRWFERKEDYLTIVDKANIFFPPRLYEGIGMPVLEALTMGKVVVAPDHPTMNEYIVDGINGLLYNPGALKPLDFSNISVISKKARASALEFNSSWIKQKEELIRWIKES